MKSRTLCVFVIVGLAVSLAAGKASADIVFQDDFPGTSLNATNWTFSQSTNAQGQYSAAVVNSVVTVSGPAMGSGQWGALYSNTAYSASQGYYYNWTIGAGGISGNCAFGIAVNANNLPYLVLAPVSGNNSNYQLWAFDLSPTPIVNYQSATLFHPSDLVAGDIISLHWTSSAVEVYKKRQFVAQREQCKRPCWSVVPYRRQRQLAGCSDRQLRRHQRHHNVARTRAKHGGTLNHGLDWTALLRLAEAEIVNNFPPLGEGCTG